MAIFVVTLGGEPLVDGVDDSTSGDAWLQNESLFFTSADFGWRRSGDSALRRSGDPGSALLGRIRDFLATFAVAAAADGAARVGGDTFRPTANTWGACDTPGW